MNPAAGFSALALGSAFGVKEIASLVAGVISFILVVLTSMALTMGAHKTSDGEPNDQATMILELMADLGC
jgi:hypothetical protein